MLKLYHSDYVSKYLHIFPCRYCDVSLEDERDLLFSIPTEVKKPH